MNVVVIRGHRLGSLNKKIAPYLRKGWTMQGAVSQEKGWNGSTRYVATLVYEPAQPTAATVNGYEQGWWAGQKALVMAMVAGQMTLEQAAATLLDK